MADFTNRHPETGSARGLVIAAGVIVLFILGLAFLGGSGDPAGPDAAGTGAATSGAETGTAAGTEIAPVVTE